MTSQNNQMTGDPIPTSISVDAADSLAARLLGDLHTKLGGLQIAHARRVAAKVSSEDENLVAAALLHDVVEKGQISFAELLTITRDTRMVELVQILTRIDGESDKEYLSRCAADPAALTVKRADLADKLSANDSNVPSWAALQIRRKARERLALLNQLADGHTELCANSFQ